MTTHHPRSATAHDHPAHNHPTVDQLAHDHMATGHTNPPRSDRVLLNHGPTLTRLAVSATLHCLTGCAIGEILGLVLATWWGWSNGPSIALAVGLAFLFGYSLTLWPVARSGVPLKTAVGVALAADTISILTMEVTDNIVVVAVPGAMQAGLDNPLFWGALALSLAVAFTVTVPVNRHLIARGKGHAVAHRYHH